MKHIFCLSFLSYISIFPIFSFAQLAEVSTSTTKIENISFQKFKQNTVSQNPVPKAEISRTVKLDESITINITSRKDPNTPIDIFVLPFSLDNIAFKKVFIKTVFNEDRGILKKYKLTINQELLNELNNSSYMRIGYCVEGCRQARAKMIVGKIFLPTQEQNNNATSPVLDTQQTF